MDGAELVEKAKVFATRAHEGQARNDPESTPYIVHPAEVAQLVEQAGGSPLEIAAAWLHDTVEDTPVTIEDIQKEFGSEVAEIVQGLTDLPEFEKLPMQERKAKQVERIKGEDASIKLVKMADQTSNVQIVGKGNLSWGAESNLIYIDGARAIIEACKGTNAFLENLFAQRYEVAAHNLKALLQTH